MTTSQRVSRASRSALGPLSRSRTAMRPEEGVGHPRQAQAPRACRPLALGRDTRARLRGAVHLLLDAPGLVGTVDAVRLATVVLAARTPEATGRVEIRTPELARWLGVSPSYVASCVLPALRRSGVVRTSVATGESGENRALICEVIPLWTARGVVGHPLALNRKELATLLRMVEAVMAPGWAHRDGSVTPAGLLGTRTGRGAPTDRLALLLLALEANRQGRVPLCGGTIEIRRGRPAATMARLLGSSASAGERVLERLEAAGVVARVRRQTASGLANRSRLLVPAVARAHGLVVGDWLLEGRGHAVGAVPADPDATAGPSAPSDAATDVQVSGTRVRRETRSAEPDGTAALHTLHAPVAQVVPQDADESGFSGEEPLGCCGLPGCACTREGLAPVVDGPGEHQRSAGQQDPLRGDKHQDSSDQRGGRKQLPDHVERRTPPARVVVGGRTHGQLPDQPPRLPYDLEAVFAQVEPLWARLDRPGARATVVAAARRELAAIAGLTGTPAAGQVLGARLLRRLSEQGGPDAVTDPVGWLRGRGLRRRPGCSDLRCDDGRRMDTSGPCEACGSLIADRRGVRSRVAANVTTVPRASTAERRAAYEHELHEAFAVQVAETDARHQRAVAERDRRAEAVAQARTDAQAAQRARRAEPCADCGRPEAAGMCPACGNRKAAERAILDATLAAAAAEAGFEGSHVPEHRHMHVVAVRAAYEEILRAQLDQALSDATARGATHETLSLLARLTVETEAATYRLSALSNLARSGTADREATLASEATMRVAHRYADLAAAKKAAARNAERARQRTAQHLLTTRIAAVQAILPPDATPHEPKTTTSARRRPEVRIGCQNSECPALGTCEACPCPERSRAVIDATSAQGQRACEGWDGEPCGRSALPTRAVCVRCRAKELGRAC